MWSTKVLRQMLCMPEIYSSKSTWGDSLIPAGFITSLILRNNLVLLSMLTERWVNLSIRNDTWKSGVSRSYVAFVDSKEDSRRYISCSITRVCARVLPYQRTYENPTILFGLTVHPCSLPAGIGRSLSQVKDNNDISERLAEKNKSRTVKSSRMLLLLFVYLRNRFL